MGDFLHELDPGLSCYIEEFNRLSVTSLGTLTYLRSHEVQAMAIPEVYKRLLLDKIADLQTPNTKMITKRRMIDDGDQDSAKRSAQTAVKPKACRNVNVVANVNDVCDDGGRTENVHDVPEDYLSSAVARVNDERDTLLILIQHKKDELENLKLKPAAIEARGIPGNPVTKFVCDNCHRRGHRATMNKGNKACPYTPCIAFSECGLETKHLEHKHAIAEVCYFLHVFLRIIQNIINRLCAYSHWYYKNKDRIGV